LRNLGVFNNTLALNQEKAPRTEKVSKRKNLSVSAPSVPAEQFSTSVLAEQLCAIEVGVKKLHVVYAANDNFYGGASPQSPSPRSPGGSYATEVNSSRDHFLAHIFFTKVANFPLMAC